MSHECNECGKEFDSERGLHIHQTQKHGDSQEKEEQKTEEPVEKTEEDKVESPNTSGINLSAKQFGGLTFATGLFLGLALGMMFTGVSLDAPTPTINNNNDNSAGNSGGVVELSNAEYPYGDLEAGVGNGERTFGDTTFKLAGEPYIGSPNADLTAVSYEDFECPFCKQFNDNAYSQIVENHVRVGEVQYFYKQLPLQNIHPWSEPAALASECALNQDPKVFWTFKQGFFDNQEALGKAFNNGNFDTSMIRWAEQTGLNVDQFQQCYDNEEELEEVQQDKQEGGDNGAQATPTIFINGEKLEGAQPYSRFQTTIQSVQQ